MEQPTGNRHAAALALLNSLGTAEHAHTKGTLRDHLIGTSALLADWGNPDHVVLGGLFHSVYGTQHFKVSSTSLDNRASVAAVIGERAEQLAFLFCVTDRGGFFHEAGKPRPKLWDLTHEQLIDVKPEFIRHLVEIEVANYVEQRDPGRPLPRAATSMRKQMLARGAAFMSPAARRTFAEMIDATTTQDEACVGSSS